MTRSRFELRQPQIRCSYDKSMRHRTRNSTPGRGWIGAKRASYFCWTKSRAARQAENFSGDPSLDAAPGGRCSHINRSLPELGLWRKPCGAHRGCRFWPQPPRFRHPPCWRMRMVRRGGRCKCRCLAGGGAQSFSVCRAIFSSLSLNSTTSLHFTYGRGHTAARVAAPRLCDTYVAVNLEAYSIKAAVLAARFCGRAAPAYDAFVREVVRASTVKAWQNARRSVASLAGYTCGCSHDVGSPPSSRAQVGYPRQEDTPQWVLVTRGQQGRWPRNGIFLLSWPGEAQLCWLVQPPALRHQPRQQSRVSLRRPPVGLKDFRTGRQCHEGSRCFGPGRNHRALS